MYSDLAMVQSKDHMERLIAAAGSDYKGDVWLGLKDYPYRWHWSFRRPNWYSGNEYYFRNWATPQPPHMRRVPLLCTAFKDGLWEVISCTTQLSFVCYYIGCEYKLICLLVYIINLWRVGYSKHKVHIYAFSLEIKILQ